jgi:hypothetical protein
MARSAPATQAIPDAGVVVALTAPNSDGDIVDAGSGAFLIVDNASGASINVTLVNPKTYNGLDVADRVVAVAAGARKHIPIPAMFKQDADAVIGPAQALVDYSAVASVTRGVARFGA